MLPSDSPKWAGWCTWLEMAALSLGLVGSATACLACYNWRWFRESLFFMIWSAAPYALFALYGYLQLPVLG